MRNLARLMATTLAMTTALAVAPSAGAHPPTYAPAHGWRARHDNHYRGYTGDRWNRDYGVYRGRCDRREAGTVIGAVLGGATGAAVSDRDDRLIAVLIGASVGAVLGREIGRDMDRSDRACFGHALELGRDGQPVYWDGPRGMHYQVTPYGGSYRRGSACRDFRMVVDRYGKRIYREGRACRVGNGEWQLR